MENHAKILHGLFLWKGRRISVAKLSGGITNFNYLVMDGKNKYVARFAPKRNVLLGLHRKTEIYNTKIAHARGLGPKVVRFFPKHNLLIVEYIEGSIFTKEKAQRNANIQLLARLLKTLHSGPKFKTKFNPFKTIREYITIAKKHKTWLPHSLPKLTRELSEVERKIGKLHQVFPCHLDLMMQNIVGNKNVVKLLDWEYSSNSDYRFDLAMLSLRGDFAKKHDKLLLKEYGNGTEDLYNQIQAMKAVVCFREAAWSMLQLAISEIKFDYKKYAVENITNFRKFAAESNTK